MCTGWTRLRIRQRIRDLTAVALQQFPATQLFVERAVASGAHLNLSDLEAPIVADICRKLDGVALAIELAARRVEFPRIASNRCIARRTSNVVMARVT